MKPSKRPGGVVIPMITPLFPEAGVDRDGVGALAEHFLRSQAVDGLFVLGASGEYTRLSVGERREVIDALSSIDRRGKTVIVNVSGADMRETVELARYVESKKLDAVAAVVPATVESSPQSILRYFQPLGAVDLPLMIYWTPFVKEHKPGRDVVEALTRIPNFTGLKDSSRDMETFTSLCADFGEELAVFQGVEMLYLPSLACGCAGVIGGGLNLYPKVLADLRSAYAAHDGKKAIELQKKASLNWARLNRYKSFRWLCKRLWAEKGLISGTHCRESEDTAVGPEEMEEIRGMMSL